MVFFFLGGGPYYKYSIMGPEALFTLLRPLHYTAGTPHLVRDDEAQLLSLLVAVPSMLLCSTGLGVYLKDQGTS